MEEIIGYHGTNSERASLIMAIGFDTNINDKVGWLGTGSYFYKENKNLAKKWAEYKYDSNIEVIKCIFIMPSNKILDITDPLDEDNKKFHQLRQSFIRKLEEEKINIKEETKKKLDGKIIDGMCKKDGYELVVAPTYTYQDVDRRNKMFSRFPNGIELCLKDSSYIVSKEVL